VILVELCCGTIRGNADPGVVLFGLATPGVWIVILALIRNRRISKPRPRIEINKTLIDGKEVTVFDQARLADLVESLRTPGLRAAKLLDPNSPVWAELKDALQGSGAIDPDSPFPVIVQVRSALQAGQLESVRHLLSDQLYQRLSASPPLPGASPQRLYMVTNRHSGDDPNRIVVRLAGSSVVPGARAEDWTVVRSPQGAAAMPTPIPIPVPTPTEANAPAAVQPSTCPYCSATLDPGAKRCRYCGMDVTMPTTSLTLPTPTPDPPTTPAPASSDWIVDDIPGASSMAA
jgi:hypothetical protein